MEVFDDYVAFIPNAFSPNGDGYNDYFFVVGRGIVHIECTIYNRWGEKLYQAEDFKQWDGRYQDVIVQNGPYIYMMTITDNKGLKHHYKGEVNVVR